TWLVAIVMLKNKTKNGKHQIFYIHIGFVYVLPISTSVILSQSLDNIAKNAVDQNDAIVKIKEAA
ncbi:23649_t:CDS:2, partial [Dentiscutata erythropus]